MSSISGPMPEKVESFGTVLKQKMKDIYEHHQKVSQGVEDQVNVLQQENTRLERLNERMQNEINMIQDRIGVLQADNKRLNGELVNTSTRLSAPCENCKSLMQQLDQQNKLVCTLLEKHDLSITNILEKYLKDKIELGPFSNKTAKSTPVPSVLHVLSQALHNTQPEDTLHNTQPEDNIQPKSLHQTEQRDFKKREKGNIKEKKNKEIIQKNDYAGHGEGDNVVFDMADSNINGQFGTSRSLKATNNGENIVHKDMNGDDMQSNALSNRCDKFDTYTESRSDDKVSPTTTTKLKLHRGKRTRHKYIEVQENAPECKRKKVSPESSTALRKKKKSLISCSQEPTCRVPIPEYTVLAPDTCNVSSVLSPRNLRNEMLSSRRRNMKNNNKRTISDQKSPCEDSIKKSVVPETVQMEASLCDDDDDQESKNTVKQQTQVLNNNFPVRHKSKDVKHLLSSVLFSPPSHSSTPLPVSPEANSNVADHSGSFISNKGTTNHVFSPPSSPVFGKSSSPPMFDESENHTNVKNNANRMTNKVTTCVTDRSNNVKPGNSNQSMIKTTDEDKNAIRIKSDSGNNSELSANESSLLLSKPNSMDSNDKNSQKLVRTESVHKNTKSSPRVRMSPLNFSVERAGEAILKSPSVNDSPSMLSGKVKGVAASPKVIKSKSPKGKVEKMLFEKGNMKKIKGKYFQTKLTSDAFKSKNTNKIRLEAYNGNNSNADSLTQEEEELLEQAKLASLKERRDQLASEDQYSTSRDVLTSTPGVRSHKPSQIPDLSVIDHPNDSEMIFKKPIPPTTPKRRNSSNDNEEVLRRSPRLKNQQLSSVCRYTEGNIPRRNIIDEESEHPVGFNKAGSDLNGTVDPHIDLAEFDSPGTMKSPYLDNITMLELDRAQNAASTQDYLASLENVNERVTRATRKCSQELQSASQESQSSKKSRQGLQKAKRPSQRTQRSQKFTENQENDMSEKSAIFGPMSVKPNVQKDLTSTESCQDVFGSQAFTDKNPMSEVCNDQLPDVDNSFDRLPQQTDDKGYKYVKVVRKQAERAKLDTYVCIECDKWFNGMGLTEEETRQRMKAGCKHKAMFAPPDTPEHYWSVGFPDTQQCKERGYMNVTQAKPSKYRRQRPLRQLFRTDNEGNEVELEAETSDFSD